MIGIFDSGVGGMTVARAIEQRLPRHSQIYFGDLSRAPYGPKSPEKIREYALENSRFLLEHGAELIVIACNSAASVAADLIAREFDVPVFEVIGPAVGEAAAVSRTGRVGVIGTRATVRSGIYKKKITGARPGAVVIQAACPLLVPLVEEDWAGHRETKMIIRRYLRPLRNSQVDTLVLGCTHYPLLGHLIGPRMGRGVRVIDSSEALAGQLADYLHGHPEINDRLTRDGGSRYFVSDMTEAAAEIAARIFGRPINLERVEYAS